MFKKILNIGVILYVFSSSAMATPINLALDGTASQSSTYQSDATFSANKAIDGLTHNLNHTDFEFQPWWQVDLGNSYAIEQIELWNRTDCCAERLSNFTVSILDNNESTVWSSFFSGPASAHEVFDLSASAIFGQTVKIQINDTNFLHLAEIQVWSNNSQLNAVPVPSAIWLFASGIAGIISYRKKRFFS